MITVLYNKIIAKAKELCSDYAELRSEYCSAISSLKTNENIIKIFYLESLLKEKNHFECAHAAYKGFILEKEDLNLENLNDYRVLFENGLDETINIKELYQSANYCELENRIKTVEKEIFDLFKDSTETIDALLETYGNFNFELIAAAFTLGCEYKQFGKLIMDTHK